MIIKHEALGCHTPLIPLPTNRAPTHALPSTNDVLPSISQDVFGASFLGLTSLSRSPGQDGDGMHHLLSPLSRNGLRIIYLRACFYHIPETVVCFCIETVRVKCSTTFQSCLISFRLHILNIYYRSWISQTALTARKTIRTSHCHTYG